MVMRYHSYHDRLNSQDLALPDLMFLPAELANRFLASFTEIIHPIFPVLDIQILPQSVHQLYGTDLVLHTRPAPQTQLEQARNMLVLAFGAQVIAGDGDVNCPKDVATVWGETLRRHALDIMKVEDVSEGGVDLIRLWIVYAAFSRSFGNSAGMYEAAAGLQEIVVSCLSMRSLPDELSAMNTAARTLTRMGLHRKGAHETTQDKANDLSMLFAVCFYSEKWACLSRLTLSLSWKHEASEIAAGIVAMVSGSHLRIWTS